MKAEAERKSLLSQCPGFTYHRLSPIPKGPACILKRPSYAPKRSFHISVRLPCILKRLLMR